MSSKLHILTMPGLDADTVAHAIPAGLRATETPQDVVERGGRAIGVCREILPTLRGTAHDESIPCEWRLRFEECAKRIEAALVGRNG